MENTYTLSLSLATPLTSLVLYVTNSTLVPEAIRCCLQTSSYCCFYQGGDMYRNVRSQNLLFELYGRIYCYYIVLPEAIFVVYW